MKKTKHGVIDGKLYRNGFRILREGVPYSRRPKPTEAQEEIGSSMPEYLVNYEAHRRREAQARHGGDDKHERN